ncbi:MAG: hypothetical protein ACYS0D_15900 [Planctomycetota bacterium]
MDAEPLGNKYMSLVQIDASSPLGTISQLDLTTEVGVDVAAGSSRTRIQLRNWTTNSWTTIEQYNQGTSDTVKSYVDIANPNDYVRPSNNRIRIRIRNTMRSSHAPDGFVARIDHVQVDVTE